MEKENKYYEVIKNLIITNKKYVGLESILEDIIDDVAAHSEIIINTVNNDAVIENYLEKVVATSIITVPKKKNIKRNNKNLDVNKELIDKMINYTAKSETDDFVSSNTEAIDIKISNNKSKTNNTLKEQEDTKNNDFQDFESIAVDSNTEDIIENINIDNKDTVNNLDEEILNANNNQEKIENIDSIEDSNTKQQGENKTNNSTINNQENITENSEQVSKIDYSIFYYEPIDQTIANSDINILKEKLESLSKTRSDLKITQVYNLKYQEKASINDIATMLSIDENEVITTLNEIIAVL